MIQLFGMAAKRADAIFVWLNTEIKSKQEESYWDEPWDDQSASEALFFFNFLFYIGVQLITMLC